MHRKKSYHKLVVFYDGSCEGCIKDRARYEHWAGTGGHDIYWFDITGREEVLLSLGINPYKALRELHVQTAEGEVFSELDAYILLMQRVPRLKPLAWLIGLPLIRPCLSWLYRTWVQLRLERQGRG
ncbi:thiol-disulfide oxidoreductase DCC family protein [Oceanisphaera sp. KMM 10153]|uniref:thiol-disulfide oxidoreductase DCC family protein n=1 Tax=Oceanisphaera submarina TaxID=3390193 RepID=UPI003976B4E7